MVPTGATLQAAVVSDAVVVGATVPVVCLGKNGSSNALQLPSGNLTGRTEGLPGTG